MRVRSMRRGASPAAAPSGWNMTSFSPADSIFPSSTRPSDNTSRSARAAPANETTNAHERRHRAFRFMDGLLRAERRLAEGVPIRVRRKNPRSLLIDGARYTALADCHYRKNCEKLKDRRVTDPANTPTWRAADPVA